MGSDPQSTLEREIQILHRMIEMLANSVPTVGSIGIQRIRKTAENEIKRSKRAGREPTDRDDEIYRGLA